MKSWIFPTNIKKFRIHDFLSSYNLIDFKQTRSAKVQVGDIVYLYCTLPEGRIVYKMKIEKINLSYSETIDDAEYTLVSTLTSDSQKDCSFCRLRLIKSVDTDLLSLNNLRINGLKSCLQSQQGVKPCLLPYIEKCFEDFI